METCLAERFGKLLREACKAKFNSKLSGGGAQSGSCSRLCERLPKAPAAGKPPRAVFGRDEGFKQSQSSASDVQAVSQH